MMRVHPLWLVVALAMVSMPDAAHAQATIDACAPAMPPGAYTQKLVYCIQNLTMHAVANMLTPLSNYMAYTVGAMIAVAIAFYSVRVLGGDKSLTRKAIALGIRIGLVWLFFYELAGLSGYLFAIEDEMISMVVGGFSPWAQIDAMLGRLIGFGTNALANPVSLPQGMMGIMAAALLTSTPGAILAIAGIFAVLNMLFFVFRVMFMYLTAVLGIGFLIVISPLVIPMALFFHTERYFKRWLDILIATMLVPVLMFAFLSIFLDGFSLMIESMFAILGSNQANTDFSAFWKFNQPLFAWLVPTDPNLAIMLENTTGEMRNSPAVLSNINPFLRRAHDLNGFKRPTIDFGPNNAGIMQRLTIAFITLWVYASVMKEMLTKIPDIASSIAGAASGVSMQAGPIESALRHALVKSR